MLIRPAQEDDAKQIAQAEYDTAASQEGLLAAKPREIPISAFRSKIKQLRVHGLYASRWRFESDHRAAELEPDHGL